MSPSGITYGAFSKCHTGSGRYTGLADNTGSLSSCHIVYPTRYNRTTHEVITVITLTGNNDGTCHLLASSYSNHCWPRSSCITFILIFNSYSVYRDSLLSGSATITVNLLVLYLGNGHFDFTGH